LGDLEDGDEVAVFDADFVDEGFDGALALCGSASGDDVAQVVADGVDRGRRR
jgi:hypothetical protein